MEQFKRLFISKFTQVGMTNRTGEVEWCIFLYENPQRPLNVFQVVKGANKQIKERNGSNE